jgi:hypothetical protein
MIARRKKARVLSQRQEVINAKESRKPDPVLGYFVPSASTAGPSRRSSASAAAAESTETKWDTSLLKKTVLDPNAIWYSQPPNYAAGETPEHLLPGIGEGADREFLFQSLPTVTTAIKSSDVAFAGDQLATLQAADRAQAAQTETMMRLLDLRNASKAGIQMINRERIVSAFGRQDKGKGPDTGSSEVQGWFFFFQFHLDAKLTSLFQLLSSPNASATSTNICKATSAMCTTAGHSER